MQSNFAGTTRWLPGSCHWWARNGFALLLLMLPLARTWAVGPQPPLEAIWSEQQLHFVYQRSGTSYRCQELKQLVIALLRAVGARPDVRISGNCSDFSAYQELDIFVAAPVEATPTNLRAASSYSPTRRVLAQLRGESLPGALDLERFLATWTPTSLRRLEGITLDSRDCALLHSVRRQLFSKLSVRVPADRFSCSGSALLRPSVIVEALIPDESPRAALSGRAD